MLITSTDNSRIKAINKLKQKKYRDKENKFLIETFNLIEDANNEGVLLEVYILEGVKLPFEVTCDVFEVSLEVMNKIKEVNTSKVIGICKKKNSEVSFGNRILLLDGVSDPGNLGTIIRSSVAFGVDTIILSLDCCDLYNDKVVRATEGAIFKIDVLRLDLCDAILKIRSMGISIYGTDVANGIDVSSVVDNDSYAVIMGNEGNGISSRVKEMVEQNIYIKTNSVESLNVAVATSIILYELNK